ncbi:MAG: roadblock/LC7 domain-containing protein [Acidobacteriota bacterium]
MTNRLWDFFDISETNKLLKELTEDLPDDSRKDHKDLPYILIDNVNSSIKEEKEPAIEEPSEIEQDKKTETGKVFKGTDPSISKEEISTVKHEEPSKDRDPLENLLIGMCRRGGFHGAVIADLNGLPLAVYNSPVDGDVLAAYSSILGESLEKATAFLNQPDANNISMDINILDKIVLRKFSITGKSYYLLIITPQNIDERAEIEVILSQIPQFLS